MLNHKARIAHTGQHPRRLRPSPRQSTNTCSPNDLCVWFGCIYSIFIGIHGSAINTAPSTIPCKRIFVMFDDILSAIKYSIENDETAKVTINSLDDAIKQAEEENYDFDYNLVDDENGIQVVWEMWGWSEGNEEDEPEWRILITAMNKE